MIAIENAVFQTIIFAFIFIAVILFTLKKRTSPGFFPKELTNELKGLAILAIIFSHIGYFLSADKDFLYPFSVLAGVGVNLFLFLSGFGLTISQMQKPLGFLEFYNKRLIKLFLPLWIILAVFIVLDLFILKKSYPQFEIINSFIGWFPKADLFYNINSPLWYFSLILFYYLIYPLFYWRRFLILSPFLIMAFGYYISNQTWLIDPNFPLRVEADLLKMYKLHFAAFPLGMLAAIFLKDLKAPGNKWFFVLPLLVVIFVYTAIHSGVGGDMKKEQIISLITMFSIILIFVLKKVESRFLSLVGIYSYEIYLLHWPILVRFDFFFKHLPAGVAVVLYIALFIALGWSLNKLTSLLENPKKFW